MLIYCRVFMLSSIIIVEMPRDALHHPATNSISNNSSNRSSVSVTTASTRQSRIKAMQKKVVSGWAEEASRTATTTPLTPQ